MVNLDKPSQVALVLAEPTRTLALDVSGPVGPRNISDIEGYAHETRVAVGGMIRTKTPGWVRIEEATLLYDHNSTLFLPGEAFVVFQDINQETVARSYIATERTRIYGPAVVMRIPTPDFTADMEQFIEMDEGRINENLGDQIAAHQALSLISVGIVAGCVLLITPLSLNLVLLAGFSVLVGHLTRGARVSAWRARGNAMRNRVKVNATKRLAICLPAAMEDFVDA